ncbi:hypothetical protein [Nonomuraea recticatena]|uniref:hypothetical protein n=1 Tax=Nonomuraea recticatena TaxID=46178 RepID=UPI003623C8BE
MGASTLCEALDIRKPPKMPSLKVVMAFIRGCGGSEELTRWTTAWRRIRMTRTTTSNVTQLLPTADQRRAG